MRLIDADRLLRDKMKSKYYHLPNGDIAIPLIDIEHAPTIEPERKTGHWIPQDRNHTHGNVSTLIYFSPVCSECGHVGDFNMNFCPNCGADMRGEQDGKNT